MDLKPKPVHMFNSYMKFTTAMVAFTLLFSTGAWSQCGPGLIAVDYAITGGNFPTEITWTLNDALGTPVDNGVAPIAGQWCLAAGDYTFIGSDSFGDGWNGATATFTNADTGVQIGFFELLAGSSGSIVITVSLDIPGCTDPLASNYNPLATIDDGTCCLNDLVTINLYDSFGDGWTWAGVAGGLDIFGVFYEFAAGGTMSVDFCLAPGCYTGATVIPTFASEGSWDVVVGGVVIAAGSGVGTVFFSTDPACVVAGCDDVLACNYNPLANVNDGSCEYLTCAGCIDPTACNYDMTATFDNGTCDFSCIGCMDPTATNYDPLATVACVGCCAFCTGAFAGILTVGGGTWDSEIGYTLTLGGVVISTGGAGSSVLCLAPGCYVLDMTDAFGDGWNGGTYSFDGYDGVTVFSGDIDTATNGDGASVGTDFLDFNGGLCTFGCTDIGACNYDMAASFDNGLCDYTCVGCLDPTAANYDPNATIDSGQCVYCAPGTFVLSLDMTDSFGDGWNGAVYFVFDLATGAVAAQGDLDTAFSGDGLSVGTDLICLAPGCYSVEISAGSFPSEVNMSLSDQFGTVYGSVAGGAAMSLDFTLTGLCAFTGCTSPSAINFNISATIDDGSCQEPPLNDQLANAEPVACGAFTAGTVLYATDDSNLVGTTFGNATLSTGGVWYTYNAAADQQVIITTCDTPPDDLLTDYTADTKLFVYTQNLDGSLQTIVSNDDGCATGFLSEVAFNAVTGNNYLIYVSNFSANTNGNDFVLTVNCVACGLAPSNDDCAGAIAQVTGVTFTGSTCCATAEAMPLGWAGNETAYGVWFTFNSSNYNTFLFNITNLTNDVLGFVMMDGNSCATATGFVGCQFTGTCAGSVESFLPQLVPNVDYYFLIYTTDPTTCGTFEFTTTGIILGCTDATANNYNPQANQDDGTCDFLGVVPPNDSCDTAIALVCNTVTTGSTGGSTNLGAPIGVAGCEVAPGTGVWYTFTGDGQLHHLSTCGSAIDSKINIYTATVPGTPCGGGGIVTPPADACGAGLVTVSISVGGGAWDSEISWNLTDLVDPLVPVVVASGIATGATPVSVCLPAGDYTLNMIDAFGDGWNGAVATFSNGLGDVIGSAGLPTGTTGTYLLTVAPYSTAPTYMAGDFTCFDSAVASDGTGVCTLFDSDDVNFEFISTLGVVYYIYVGAEDIDGNPATDNNGTFDLTFDCAPVVEGCMNVSACNYDVLANVDLPLTCDYFSCVCATPTGTAIQLNMYDSFGDGWNNAGYTISDLAGVVLFTGSLDLGQYTVDINNFAGPEFGWDLLCLEPGCYNITIAAGDWPSEVSWDITLADGTILAAGGAPDSQTISVGGAVCGCTDMVACNYDPLATVEDGTCEYLTCAGCTDLTSCNYDATATIDDGTCCFSNCVDVQLFDSFGDGWNGAIYTLSSVDGTVIGTGTIANGSAQTDSYCLANGCYIMSVTAGSWPGEVSWNIIGAFGGLVGGVAEQSVTFNVGTGAECVTGCDIACACNFDPLVNIADVAQCVFVGCSGCTYPGATNFDPLALAINDDGSCIFTFANPCPADLNGDGSITTGDLLIFLGAFGTIC